MQNRSGMNAGWGCLPLKHRSWTLMLEIKLNNRVWDKLVQSHPTSLGIAPRAWNWWDMGAADLKLGGDRRD